MVEETRHHLLSSCHFSSAIWSALSQCINMDLSNSLIWYSGGYQLLSLNSSLNSNSKAIVANAMWFIWYFRNNILHDEGRPSTNNVVMRIVAFSSSYVKAHLPEGSVDSNISVDCWIPPPSNFLKINCDRVFNNPDGAAGLI
ncbi:hypothetical protein Cni_G16236 [Canna indica]|uniref:Uncharacterized protein n=1 Tax=Canna indica TaxID=4628 RepID=A0AAQ3KER6_9LILI|nr:hypothetical protein Cni_G16236 [Canna indica]